MVKRAVKKSKPQFDETRAYAEAVIAGDVVAGRLVRLACERHLRDLREGAARGLHFDVRAAGRAIAFFGLLRLPCDGELDGKPFTLSPFQAFIIGSLFGWKGADDFRRFRTAYIEQGKGSGKTPLAAGVGLYGLVADDEAGAEIYSAATMREQAGILFRDARRMAEASPALRSALDIDLHNIAYPRTDSFLRPVSSEHRGLDGKRPHMALIDEVHEHPNAMVVDKMRLGTKGRRQALICEITNSGHDRHTVCWAHHEYSENILTGVIADDSWFAYVCGLDACDKCRAEGQTQPKDGCRDCDDWRDEKVWPKANPNLGVSITLKYLREVVHEALGMPTKEGIVKRLNFCLWTEGETRAIPMDCWDACAGPIDWESFRGRECWAGLDIGATSDFTALVLLFPHEDGETVSIPVDPAKPESERLTFVRRSFSLLPLFWMPERSLRRDERMRAVIEGWKRAGFVKETPGDVVDYDLVLLDLLAVSRRFSLRGIGFDRGFQGSQMGNNLMTHFGEEVVRVFPQGILSMNAPFREFLELTKLRRLHHDGNPVMRWMCFNTVAEARGGLIKPSKDRSPEKIDGVTAGVMGLGLAFAQTGAGTPSISWL
jgi:phage terminase large subunit-like protein